MAPLHRQGAQIVLVIDDKQRTYTRDDDGLMWSYRAENGRRWIGWRALAEMFGRALEERADELA